jgi:hypothetical protein
MPRILDFGAFNAVRESGMAKLVPAVPLVAIGMGTCGRGNGAEGSTTLSRRLSSVAATHSCWRQSVALERASKSRWSVSGCPEIR